MADLESGTHPVSSALSPVEVERACSEIDGAVVVLAECLELLAELTTNEPREAVRDAQAGVQRIREIVDALHQKYEGAAGDAAKAI